MIKVCVPRCLWTSHKKYSGKYDTVIWTTQYNKIRSTPFNLRCLDARICLLTGSSSFRTSVYSRALELWSIRLNYTTSFHSQNFRSFHQKLKPQHWLKCCYWRLHGPLEVDKLFRIQQIENAKGALEGSQKSAAVYVCVDIAPWPATEAIGKGTGMVSAICGQMLYHRESVPVSTVAHSQGIASTAPVRTSKCLRDQSNVSDMHINTHTHVHTHHTHTHPLR